MEHLTSGFFFLPLACRFSGLKFPDMSNPETLGRKYKGKLPPEALAFMCSLLELDPANRLTCTQVRTRVCLCAPACVPA